MESKRRTGEIKPLLGGRYTLGLTAALLASVAFTITDFVTSFVALNRGFAEGNTLLTGLAGSLSLGTIGSLLVMKAVFIAGVSSLAVIGAKSQERTTKKLALASITVFVFVFACVSVNNLYWLVS
jgi:hypothetical protein